MNYLPSHVDEDVHRNALNDAVLQAWAEHLRKWRGDEAKDYERNNAFYGFQLEHMGAKDHRQHPAGWIACEAGQLLLTAFTAAAQSYLSHVAENVGVVRPDVSPDHLHVWASLHQPCSTHPRHVHAGASLSGVYYVRIPPTGGGRLEFSDPRGYLPPFTELVVYHPSEGDLILFPPWVPHEVTSNCRAQAPRISISFNYYSDLQLQGEGGFGTEGSFEAVTARFRHVLRSDEARETAAATVTADGVSSEVRTDGLPRVRIGATAGGLDSELMAVRLKLRKFLEQHGGGDDGGGGQLVAAHFARQMKRIWLASEERAVGIRLRNLLEGVVTDAAALLEEVAGVNIEVSIVD